MHLSIVTRRLVGNNLLKKITQIRTFTMSTSNVMITKDKNFNAALKIFTNNNDAINFTKNMMKENNIGTYLELFKQYPVIDAIFRKDMYNHQLAHYFFENLDKLGYDNTIIDRLITMSPEFCNLVITKIIDNHTFLNNLKDNQFQRALDSVSDCQRKKFYVFLANNKSNLVVYEPINKLFQKYYNDLSNLLDSLKENKWNLTNKEELEEFRKEILRRHGYYMVKHFFDDYYSDYLKSYNDIYTKLKNILGDDTYILYWNNPLMNNDLRKHWEKITIKNFENIVKFNCSALFDVLIMYGTTDFKKSLVLAMDKYDFDPRMLENCMLLCDSLEDSYRQKVIDNISRHGF